MAGHFMEFVYLPLETLKSYINFGKFKVYFSFTFKTELFVTPKDFSKQTV